MNKIIIALGISLAASTAAFADSSALDAYQVPAQQGAVALATGTSNQQVEQVRLGDGSPVYLGGVDYNATASIAGQASTQPLGASPRAL
ncbi:hypothetical protein DFR52_102678 [Hoeflea marina]|uniref:Uncharacterized protein n=1 Tax=Hoeflea marina TaxID=274592 RepID=A0A317PN85_9HYPH|nr:hypothetical protein [Hoeflea marina]PWW02013.1 hypothetical protein DFR52_102678 [Hoeflea marina]